MPHPIIRRHLPPFLLALVTLLLLTASSARAGWPDWEEVKVYGVRAFNDGDGARRLRVKFTRPLAPEVTAETLGRWLRVEPMPRDFKVTLCPIYNYQTRGTENLEAELTGAFAIKTDYRVTVEPGLPGCELSIPQRERWTNTFHFDPLPPRLKFPEFAVHQLVSGHRQFELRAVNVPEVRLRARLFPAGLAGRAMATYQKVYLSDNGKEDYERLDFAAIPGQTIYQQTVPGTAAGETGDDAKTLTLNWNDILGPDRRAGVVLLEAEQPAATAGGEDHRRAGTQALVQLTDLGLVWKRAHGGELLVYAFSLSTAQPAAGATVQVLDAEGRPLGEARADAEGVARLSTAVATVGKGNVPAYLLAARGEDCHVVPFAEGQRDEIGLYRFHLPLDRDWDEDESPASAASPARTPRETLLFSDRAVYQPGETLHLKAIVRDWPTVGEPSAPPAGTLATLRAFDARGRRFWEKRATLGAAGSLTEDITLPKSVLGRYRVTIAYPDGTAAEATAVNNNNDEVEEEDDNGPETPDLLRFQVQQYRPNPFEVKLTAPTDLAPAPGRVEVPLAARYYMGTPLSKAKVTWNLEARDSVFKPDGFTRYTFNTADMDSRLERNPGEVNLHGDAALGADGTLKLGPEIALNTVAPGPRTGQIIATVTDIDQASVTARARLTVHASAFYLGLRELPEVVHEGEPVPLEVVAVRANDGQPVPAPMPVRVRLSRVNWTVTRPANASGGYDYHSEPHVEFVSEREVTTTVVHRVGREWLPDSITGDAAPLTAGEPGEYLLELLARDDAGREVLTAKSFDVLGKSESTWSLRDVRRVDLVPDRVEYTAGQTATILLKTPFGGRALVTVEREGVRRAFSVEVKKETPAVTVPLESGDAPNVFVSVLLLRGADESPRRVPEPEFRVGYCQLSVSRPESRLAVMVAAAREQYQPGEDVAAVVQVANHEGKPVAGAEVTLYAVDEGILSLTGYRTPDPIAAFFRRRALGVRTGLTLPSLMSEDPTDREFGNKGYLVGGGGIELRGDRLRENFAACAVWKAGLVTDADGRARTTFTAPDSLSRYRLMAVVHDGGNRFGSGEGAFRIVKPLMLEPALPRFGNVGDRILLRAVLHNSSPTAGEVEVGVTLDDRAVIVGDAKATRRVRMAAGESLAVDFPVEFARTGRAEWTWRARLAGEDGVSVFNDSVKTTLNVGHPVPRRSEVFAFAVPAGARWDDLLNRADPALLGGAEATLEVSVSNSRLGELREGIGALLHYPYGCVEQTTSSLLPWLGLQGVGGGAEALPELAQTKENVEDAVARGVNRLLTMQTEDGGLAYWPGGKEAHPWGSAYGGLGMAMAKRAGFPVPTEPFKRLCEALSKNLRSDATPLGDRYHEHHETDRCLSLLALAMAGRAEPAYHERMFAGRDGLAAEDRALLALAIAESHGPAEMVDALLRPDAGRRVEETDRNSYNTFSGRASLLGMRLLAWSRYQPADPAVGMLLNALLGERQPGGSWPTTQGNAWGLLAVGGYVEAVERNAGINAAKGEIVLAGKRSDFALTGGVAGWTREFPLTGGPAALSVVNPNAHPLFVQVKLSARPTSGAPAATDAGFHVARRYDRLTDDGQVRTASAGSGDDWKVGDRVLVSLDVEAPLSAAYVVVDDPLPATLEAVNPEFKTSDAAVAPTVTSGSHDWWNSSFRELREDRALFFCDRLYAGRYHLQYLARVRAAGTATAPATKVEEMYHPERFGLGAVGTVRSVPLE